MQTSVSLTRREPRPLIAMIVTGAALVVAGLLLLLYAQAAWEWQEQPFLGFLPSRTLAVTDYGPLTNRSWPALDAGIETGDQLVAYNGIRLDTRPAGDRLDYYYDLLMESEDGSIVTASFLQKHASTRPTPRGAVCLTVPDTIDMRECRLALRLTTLPSGDLVGYFGVGWLTGIILLATAAVLFIRQPQQPLVRLIAVLSAAVAVLMAGMFDTVSTHLLIWAWLPAGCLTGAFMAIFGMEFPYQFAFLQRTPSLRWAPVVVALAISGAGMAFYYSAEEHLSRTVYAVVCVALVLGTITVASMMLWRRSRSASPGARNQSTLILIGLIPAVLPSLVWLLWLVFMGRGESSLTVFNAALPVLFPLTATYAISQSRIVDTDRVITQSVLHGALLGMLTISYFLLMSGIALLVGRSIAETALSPAVIALTVFAVAVLFSPARLFLQRLIDAAYFRTRRVYQMHLERFSSEITNAVTLRDVMGLVQRYLDDTLLPSHVMLFVRNIVTYEYEPLPDPHTGERPTDITFGAESGLVRHLRDRASLLYLEEGRPLPLEVVSDRARLAVLGAPVICRLKGQKVLSGFVAIGPRHGGAPYVHEDLRFMESLSDQVALAVERAQAVDDLERRIRVQDVLSQVSRALNFAIDFDMLLELVYAQTSRVIDAPSFYIALRDPNTNDLYYVFYNEGDERLAHMEGQRWRIGRDLMSEIARTQQTIRTDDYVRESLARDPRAELINRNLKAWMGVPLLADTGGVLGVMVAATTEPGLTFTDEQQDLFWDIANLAASAIDKLQLFDKTQQRARQLSALNQISTRLASEIGSVDRLLRLITESAVQILNTEAGSLLLADDETGDLVFHVVVGGGGEELVGQHIPAGSGLAGATVQRGIPIIVNDPIRDSRWYGDIRPDDEPLGGDGTEKAEPVGAAADGTPASHDNGNEDDFHSRAILSVPLLVQGRAIGVLQTINKRDTSIFVQEDADLLATFAGQAAIAIENARLFDMTDQQLALRVQELDTMQRIDQELNRTLNLDRVVDITMDWALRKSGASSGALFILDREARELRLVVAYGYEHHPFGKPGSSYSAEQGVMGRVIRSGQPSLITDVSIDPDYIETLPDCVAQLIVPLFSANQVIGLIILESSVEGELDLLDLDFVARLAEHASPAIVNAQLYHELERANLAKSEFVSFVAHELKNPMTSMKGYADLLIKGVVGPVNEQQSDFLHTIFNNVNRMETLVSDLNDLTKQETDNLRLEIFPVDFRTVVIETLRAQQRQVEDKNQELRLEVPDDLPPVLGDQNRLVQIMTNFVSNAYKYTPPGGTISIHAEAARNAWDPQGAPEVVHCYVRDTGIGLSEEDMSKLFTPYFRSENPKTREQPGTGLGLTITKGLIEQHGGRIWVESVLEKGTTFHFTIPIATEELRETPRSRR